ncbi:MAG: sulfatase-like hydrolase/transferase [Planctomycetota bacterium]|nr:sulfatase-like hydrolase/transferase [Planctomycetota bacterium]
MKFPRQFATLMFFLAVVNHWHLFHCNRSDAKQPNIVWIVSEDNSIHYLNHFFPGGAVTPNIEALAASGLTFDHAYSNAPVCSVARTTLATGCYGPRIGTQFHRRYQLAPMPPGLKMFPGLLRDAGYYTTNNSKKDYNAIEGEGVWDQSSGKASWRNRSNPSQPFFHMQSHGQSHEGSLHFNEDTFLNTKTDTDPATVDLADYHPDTPLFRYTHAYYLDRMQAIDQIVGETVQKLKDDGVLEDTFIFYFGDHGGVLPKSKGYLTDAGVHVPLVVRVPKNFQELAPTVNGSRLDGFVSFVDFGPTVLNLAGVPVPEQMDGIPFLGTGITDTEINRRNEAFSYADRFDEKYDFVRALHVGNYQYIRSYQPYLPDGLNNNYRYKNLAYAQWRDLFKSGDLTGAPLSFFQPKPIEALYDCATDPHQVKNLAGLPEHQDRLKMMREKLNQKLKSLPDLSFYPESYLVQNAMDNPTKFGEERSEEIARLIRIADLALEDTLSTRAEQTLIRCANSKNSMVRYWSMMVCAAMGTQSSALTEIAQKLLEDQEEIVRIRAAEFLGIVGKKNPQPTLINVVNTTGDPVVATEALNAVVLFKDFYDGRYPVTRDDFHPKTMGADVDDRLNYINGIPYPPKKKKNAVKPKGKP